ncbi:MAG TPA: DUF6519 domain-containing protein [Ideonella sp.]|uniref:DUF6519 domain-containing protein n=1 Tax=Ideonella sp. TaxID=1929293 RepID=UPI002CA9800A|nr:DUF6519 domain-containing protein [Ideonella sp.]HSI51430.1 DUF6519 domain-containing protein [Ideonella sp.]
MKTQISRDSLAPDPRYAGVFLQQGRMILDADWNELSALQNSRLVAALRDAISGSPAGPSDLLPLGGAPRHGGLRLYADPAGSNTIRLQPGVLYVDGVPALLPGSAPMAVTGQPDYPIQAAYSGASLKLYADVWDRCVTALERPELMDPALHGADTSTRTQTLLQVKWCPAAQNPLDPAFNPPLGNAPLTLTLRKIDSGNDPCNPCAQQVQVDERLGNYLFRVEVHDVDLAAKTLTLKWSRDNGAEAAAVNDLPTGFNQGDWVWEFFDTDTERLLGLHFAPNPLKLRGLIKETCVTPLGANEPKAFVRQWDGYGVFKLDTGALVNGRDRGVALFTGSKDDPAHGRAHAEAGKLSISLEALSLELGFQALQFVPGDHWQASVREAVQASGDVVLSSGLPRGVRHHYLLLGELQADGKLKPLPDDAARRRMAFPPLTDITAADVGFADHCPGLFMGAQNVQQALDNLCAIGADDIGYTLPTCATSPNVRELLGLSGVSTKVSNVLDKLLCELRANDIPLDKTDASLCADLQLPSVVSVQDALKALCQHSGGCEVSVRTSEQLMTVLKQAAADQKGSLWVKLCAGDYVVDSDVRVVGLTALRLSGESATSARIMLSSNILSVAADELILENLGLTFQQSAGQLVLEAPVVTVRDCEANRLSNKIGGPAMISVQAPKGGACTLAWDNNRLQAWISIPDQLSWAPARVAADDAFLKASSSAMRAMALDSRPPQEILAQAANAWQAMPAERRKVWLDSLKHATLPGSPAKRRAGSPTQMSTEQMVIALSSPTVGLDQQIAALGSFIPTIVLEEPDHALRLADNQVGGCISGSQFAGWLLLANGFSSEPIPQGACNFPISVEGDVIQPAGVDLVLRDNTLTGVHACFPSDAFQGAEEGMWLVRQIPGYGRTALIGNRLMLGSVFTTHTLIAQGNTWSHLGYETDVIPAASFCDRIVLTGNVLEGVTEPGRVAHTAYRQYSTEGNNLQIDLWAAREKAR